MSARPFLAFVSTLMIAAPTSVCGGEDTSPFRVASDHVPKERDLLAHLQSPAVIRYRVIALDYAELLGELERAILVDDTENLAPVHIHLFDDIEIDVKFNHITRNKNLWFVHLEGYDYADEVSDHPWVTGRLVLNGRRESLSSGMFQNPQWRVIISEADKPGLFVIWEADPKHLPVTD